ncbi:MAG: hypothetical protein WDW38_010725 [Sanguina aurantia]
MIDTSGRSCTSQVATSVNLPTLTPQAPPAPSSTSAGAAPSETGAGTATQRPVTDARAAKLALVLLDNVGAFYYQDKSVRGAPARTGHEGPAAAPNAVLSLHGVHTGGYCRSSLRLL